MKRAGLIALFLVLGCHKKSNGPSMEEISQAFTAAGLQPSQFAPTDATRFNAARCYVGRIEGIDALVCEYATPEAASLGKQAGEQWAASAPTAAVLGNGRTLLALADRAHTDPNGRTIHKITRTFTRTR